jgi:hypothetical protein
LLRDEGPALEVAQVEVAANRRHEESGISSSLIASEEETNI